MGDREIPKDSYYLNWMKYGKSILMIQKKIENPLILAT